MYFQSQAEYVAYHSPTQRAERAAQAERHHSMTVGSALLLFNDGDVSGARQVLFDGGISDEGIAEYLRQWGAE